MSTTKTTFGLDLGNDRSEVCGMIAPTRRCSPGSGDWTSAFFRRSLTDASGLNATSF